MNLAMCETVLLELESFVMSSDFFLIDIFCPISPFPISHFLLSFLSLFFEYRGFVGGSSYFYDSFFLSMRVGAYRVL